jgi:hypothetical protein
MNTITGLSDKKRKNKGEAWEPMQKNNLEPLKETMKAKKI